MPWALLTLNSAVTLAAPFTVNEQAEVPVHAPLHPAKVEPALAAAESCTLAPRLNDPEHVVGQLIPVGVLVTTPGPVTVTVT
jgi:hypothetical protein